MKAQVISFHCVLKTKLGKVISSTFNHDVLTWSPDPNAMLPGLVEGLQNLKTGEKRNIALSAENAYGFYDPKKVIICAREGLKRGELKLGESLKAQLDGQDTMFRVTEVHDGQVTLDANHPLAGQDLVFEIEAFGVRDATSEDLPVSRFH